MSNIDKRALRERAESTIGILENIAGFEPSDIDGDTVELRFETEGGFDTGCDVSIVDECQKAADVVRALLDELEAKDKQIADLKEAFSIALSAAGIDVPAAAGKGEAS
ncbi:ead/Ea22-like family protein [Enterobacter hormaechei]|uniref:ead/Ea22-like family protein n=1 Tax=Enterobacter hormaechei TaxID=158836 RepID=UPI0030CEE66D